MKASVLSIRIVQYVHSNKALINQVKENIHSPLLSKDF